MPLDLPQLSAALDEYNLRDVTPVAVPHLDPIIAAARLVERLLPGECETCAGNGKVFARNPSAPSFVDPTHLDDCPVCRGSGRVWDEGIVEAVAKALPDSEHFSTDEDYHQAARIVLSAIAQLAEASSDARWYEEGSEALPPSKWIGQ